MISIFIMSNEIKKQYVIIAAGFTITRGGNGGSRLKSELSFTGGGQGQECLSRISENSVDYAAAVAGGNGSLHNGNWGGGSDNNNNNNNNTNNNNNSNSIVFSSSVSQNQTNNKRSSRNDDDPDLLLHCLNALETQVVLLLVSFFAIDDILHPSY